MARQKAAGSRSKPPSNASSSAAVPVRVEIPAAESHDRDEVRRQVLDDRLTRLTTAIGEVIKFRRNLQGLTEQRALEKKLTWVGQSQLSEIENGKRTPKLEALLDICDALNLSLSTLIHDAELSGPPGTPPIRSYSRPLDSYDARLGQAVSEKRWIAEYVAFLLNRDYEGQTVGIDGGTTHEFVGQAIGRYVVAKLPTVSSILTNHICIPEAVSLSGMAPHVILTGGRYRAERKTMVGPEVVSAIESCPLKASLVGTNGFDFPCLYTGEGSENDVKLAYLKRASEVFLAIDPLKWGRQTSARPLVDIRKLLDNTSEENPKTISLITVLGRANPHSDIVEFHKVAEVAAKIFAHFACTIEFAPISSATVAGKGPPICSTEIANPDLTELLDRWRRRADFPPDTERGLVIRFKLSHRDR